MGIVQTTRDRKGMLFKYVGDTANNRCERETVALIQFQTFYPSLMLFSKPRHHLIASTPARFH